MAKVKNLVSWAGNDFSHAFGAIIDLPDDVAEARVEAGLAAWPDDPGHSVTSADGEAVVLATETEPSSLSTAPNAAEDSTAPRRGRPKKSAPDTE